MFEKSQDNSEIDGRIALQDMKMYFKPIIVLDKISMEKEGSS